MTNILIIYLLTINLLSGCIFAFDKRAAIKGRRRISERALHLFELLGGVIAIWPLMYLLHHKNRKFSYYAITYVVMIAWIATIVLVTQKLE